MRLRLLDTDVMIDVSRGYQPAVTWLASLPVTPGIPGFVAMELLTGCKNKSEVSRLKRQILPFRVYWPTVADCERAFEAYAKSRLSQNLGLLDALIGECTVGMNAILCTFNTKHFQVIPGLTMEHPYKKADPDKR